MTKQVEAAKPEVAGAVFDFKDEGAGPVIGSCPALDISTNGNFYSNLSPFTTWFVTVIPHEGVDYSNVTEIRLLMPRMYARATTKRPELSPGARRYST